VRQKIEKRGIHFHFINIEMNTQLPIEQLTNQDFTTNPNYIKLLHNNLEVNKFYYMESLQDVGPIKEGRYYGEILKIEPPPGIQYEEDETEDQKQLFDIVTFICDYKYNPSVNRWEVYDTDMNTLKIQKYLIANNNFIFYKEKPQIKGGKRKIRKTRRAKKSKRYTRRH
jgi:hypothetical protein